MMTIRAVYESGVLRPLQPLALPDGETFEVTIARTEPVSPLLRAPTPAEEEYARRIKGARSLDEMYAVMATAPKSPDETYDFLGVINESRRLTGFRMPDLGLEE